MYEVAFKNHTLRLPHSQNDQYHWDDPVRFIILYCPLMPRYQKTAHQMMFISLHKILHSPTLNSGSFEQQPRIDKQCKLTGVSRLDEDFSVRNTAACFLGSSHLTGI